MKRLLLILILFSALSAIPAPVAAHDLIPKNVQEYLQKNPQATDDEIKAFVEGNAPDLAKAKSQESVIRLVRQRQTSFLDNAFDFLKLGIRHILSGPDHILFVLSLLLVYISLRHTLRLTLTFTAAHSITLILAGSGILTLSSRIVEPMIALSISFMAIFTVFFHRYRFARDVKSKMGLVFFFGLFHGLGFAGLLKEIQVPSDKFVSSLASFNIGIEVGQLIIVALALPIIYSFRQEAFYPRAVKVVAGTIGVIGLFWATQRVFGF